VNKFFGLNVLQLTNPWPLVPFGSYRFWDNGCRWGLVNIADGVFDWTHVDKWLALLAEHQVTDYLFELSGTPTWASQMPNFTGCDYASGSCGAPVGLNRDGTGPNLVWRRWVAEVSAHVKAAAFGIWNEFGRQPGQPNVKSISWAGSNEQLVRMAEDARCIITGFGSVTATKETAADVLKTVGLSWSTSSSSIILSPSIGVEPVSRSCWESYIATPGALEAAEAIAVHTYTTDPVALYNALISFRSLTPNKAVWSSEGSWGQVFPADQAAYVTGYVSTLEKAGIERFYWYAYDDPGWGTLWTPSGLTPAGQEYKRLANA
jgi:hypothetical protein